MKSGEFAIAFPGRRMIVLCVFLWGAMANSSFDVILSPLSALFSPLSSLHSPLLHAQTQRGKASFYARRATGTRTANGERLHHDSMTCAHLTLPFGTLLKVTHTGNNRSVVVRVNDRGPYARGRIIDLSWRAAKELGMLQQGIATVFIEPAGQITIPLRPQKEHFEVPEFRFELDADTLKPIWQHELEIDHKKVQKRMERTAQKLTFQRLLEHIGW